MRAEGCSAGLLRTRAAKSQQEIRNPKAEIRRKSEAPKSDLSAIARNATADKSDFGVSDFGRRPSAVAFIR
jgi:hypothetical protein